ncbi:MAG: Phytochrome-like protein cph1 [Planctomycetes bacterium ADurb.Bin401]|nr:MAG: Phytochrome-like protein cph1 [Planctomycetes bacterium ADurb.Bin401]
MNKNKNKKFRSLTFSVAVAFLSLSATVLIIANTLQIYFNICTQRDLIAGRQKLIAQEAADTVKGYILEKSEFLKTAVKVGKLINTDKSEQKLVMEKILGFNQAFRQVVLLNSKQQQILRQSRLSNLLSGQLTEQIKKRGEEILPEVLQGKTYISPVYFDSITSEPLIIMGVPVKDSLGNFQMIVLSEINLKFMWDIVNPIKAGENGRAYVVDSQGALIAFGDIGRVLKRENLLHLKEVAKFVSDSCAYNEGKIKMSKGIMDTCVATTHAHLGTPNWAVMVETPIYEAYAPILSSLNLAAITMFSCFGFSIVASHYLSKRITRPIIHLRDAAEKIGQGQMNTKIEHESFDEIGQLAEGFNQMVEDLQKTTVSRDALIKEVHERKNAEQSLEQTAEKLEQANQELKNFVYIASHDLREPLRKITAFGQLLEKSLGNKLEGDDAENLKFMVDGADRMSQMINGLLTYSRVNTQSQPFQTVDLNKTVKELQKFELSVVLEEKNAWIEIPSPLPCIEGDPVHIRQLIQNLIANGIKYQKKDSVPEITISSKPAADNMVRIEVSDNGIGIVPEYQNAIFTMFKRLHTRSEYEGTGIGLSVCKRIVERHGGHIGVESIPGKGSTFWFTVPRAKELIIAEIS